jgi:hypothetical protein
MILRCFQPGPGDVVSLGNSWSAHGRPYEEVRIKWLSNSVPATMSPVSGCGLKRDHTPQSGLKQPLVATTGLHESFHEQTRIVFFLTMPWIE